MAEVSEFVGAVSGRGRAAGLPGLSADAVEEFRVLYSEHFHPLSSYCGSLVGDRFAGAEIAQEAFTRLFARWRSVRDPRAFVFFVGTNLAIDWWRRRQREQELVRRLEPAEPVDRDAVALRDVVDRLSPKLRQVVLLHYYADLPLLDIARLLHRPLGTVKRRLHDARASLARSLEDR